MKAGTILFRLYHGTENKLTDMRWMPSLTAVWGTANTPLLADIIEISILKGPWCPGIYHEGPLRA